MARTESKMIALGTKAPPFRLKDTEGRWIELADFKGSPAYLMMFICNHCPYVKHVRPELARLTAEYLKKGIAVFAINSNDTVSYPEDNYEMMIAEKKSRGYAFPYLLDETQDIARAYDAACTPDFYLFDTNLSLVYRGQMDASRPGSDIPVTGADLRGAMDAILNNKPVSKDQKPSLGCNIKWKE